MMPPFRTGEGSGMAEKRIALAGKLLCVDSGAYSDYCVTGFFVGLRDFDPMDELERHLDDAKEQREPCCFKEGSFLARLLAKGLLMGIEYGTLHLGCDSNSDEVRFTPAMELADD